MSMLSWPKAVKAWNGAAAWKDDLYALPKKGGEFYDEVRELMGQKKPATPAPVAAVLPAAPAPAPVVAPVIEHVTSMADYHRLAREKQQRDSEEIERKREQLKKQNMTWADKMIEFWQGKADHIKRQDDFYKDIREWRQPNQNKILISLASDLSEEEFVKTAGKYFNSDKDAKAFHVAVFVTHGVDYPSVDIIDSKPKAKVSEKLYEADPNELTAEEQRQINTSIFNSRMNKERIKANSEDYVKSIFSELRENMKAKPKTPEPPAKESDMVNFGGLTDEELALRGVTRDQFVKMSSKEYLYTGEGAKLSHLPPNQIRAGFNWLKSKHGSLYEETKFKAKKLFDSRDFSKANRKKTMRIDFDSEEQRKEYFMDLYFADPFLWEALNFNIVKHPATRRPEGEFKRWNK